jgi:hypothetical protein
VREQLEGASQRARRQSGGFDAGEAEAVGLVRELAAALAPVDADAAPEDAERRLHELGEREELVRGLGPGGDPVDDLTSDRLGVARRLEPVPQASDAVGDVAASSRRESRTIRRVASSGARS